MKDTIYFDNSTQQKQKSYYSLLSNLEKETKPLFPKDIIKERKKKLISLGAIYIILILVSFVIYI